MSAGKIGVDSLISKWPLPDGTEVEVKSSKTLWDFLASKRHPQQRVVDPSLIRDIEQSIICYGFVNGLCEPVQVNGDNVINWQHRTEVFRKTDITIPVRIVFGVPLAAMSIASKRWKKSEVANLALSERLLPGEHISRPDQAVAFACENIVFTRTGSTEDEAVRCTAKWLPEVRIARGLKQTSRTHTGALSKSSIRACIALGFSRFGDDRMTKVYDAIIEEKNIPTIAGFYALLDKWDKRDLNSHRRCGAACLRGFESWAVKCSPVKTWRITRSAGSGTANELDDETRMQWQQWKRTQLKNGRK